MPIESRESLLWPAVPVPIQMTGIMSRVGGSHNFPAARYSYNGHNETCSAPVKVRIQVGQLLLGELTRPGLPTH